MRKSEVTSGGQREVEVHGDMTAPAYEGSHDPSL